MYAVSADQSEGVLATILFVMMDCSGPRSIFGI